MDGSLKTTLVGPSPFVATNHNGAARPHHQQDVRLTHEGENHDSIHTTNPNRTDTVALPQEEQMKYLLSFTISTEADPSTLLDLLHECAESFVENLDSMHDQPAELDEDSPSVEEKEGGEV